MFKFKQWLVAFSVVLGLVSLVAILPPANVGAQGPPERPASNVNVVNTPDVHVVNTPDVNVANTVRVSEPFREAVNVREQFDGIDGHAAGTLFTVPAGKQLVVTHVSALIGVPAGQQMLTVVRTVEDAGPIFFHYLKPTAVNDSLFLASEPMEFRLNAGTRVEAIANVVGFSEGPVSLSINVSGYLVNMP